MKKFLLVLGILILLTGCSGPAPVPINASTGVPTNALTSTPIDTHTEIMQKAGQVLAALKNQDMAALAALVSPTKGLLFSPYSFVHTDSLVFPVEKLKNSMTDQSIYLWGAYDGSGEPINLTFKDYLRKFDYTLDYAKAPQVGYNQDVSGGNMVSNASKYFPGSVVVEYYFPGFDSKYAGMDWQSLRLVFQQENGQWYLVALVHSQWTT